MTTKLSTDSVKAIEALTAIKNYRDCTAEEAFKLLTADTSADFYTAKEDMAEALFELYTVIGNLFFETMHDAGMELDDFEAFRAARREHELDDPGDENPDDPVIR